MGSEATPRQHPAKACVSVDIVVFCQFEHALKVLLIERKHDPFAGSWALPGGHVEDHESLDAAATRELEEETGLKSIAVNQFYTFGNPERDPRHRSITVAYFAYITPDDALMTCAGDDAADAKWYPVHDLPELAFDHDDILTMGLNKLIGSGIHNG